MPDALPQPEKRRSFTPKQRAEIVWSQGYKCAHCECSLITRPFQIDHIQRIDALGAHEPDNWQALCVPCHKTKTKVDNAEAKKGRRIRGEAGQAKRRRERGGSSIKAPAVSALSKDARGYVKRKIVSRGFGK